MKRVVGFLLAILVLQATAATTVTTGLESYVSKVSSLIAPAKLATLGPRGANPRVQKYVALLAQAEAEGLSPSKVAARAVASVGMKGRAAKLTVSTMTRNLGIAHRLGCLDKDGLRDMRRGTSPKVRRGPYQGDELSVDHIIPRAVVPELDNVIANLELMPMRMNGEKRAAIGDRQRDLAKKLNKAGLLTRQGLKAVMRS